MIFRIRCKYYLLFTIEYNSIQLEYIGVLRFGRKVAEDRI